MAINNYNSNKLSLNRSFSFSGSPITQKVCVEQSFQNHKGETLIRQYSCEQIYDHSKKSTVHQVKQSIFLHGAKNLDFPSPPLEQIPVSSPNKQIPTQSVPSFQTHPDQFPVMSRSANFGFSKICPEQKGFQDSLRHNRNRIKEIVDDCTPMEVDTSLEESSMADVHTPSHLSITDENKVHRNKVSKLATTPVKSNKMMKQTAEITNRPFAFGKYLKFTAMILIPVACALIFMQTGVFIGDDSTLPDHFDAGNITNALQDLLYGQQEVILRLRDSLTNVVDNRLIVFTGGIGVGKTYAANIISNNFPWKNNVVKIISPQYKTTYYESKFIRSISRNGYNLLIVDNLEVGDTKSVIAFVKKILATDKKVIVLLIFTIPEYSIEMTQDADLTISSTEISDSLTEANMKHSLIIFEKLSEEIVTKCIRYAMAKKGLIINKYNIEHVLQNVNFEYSGCKGVYSKVALLR